MLLNSDKIDDIANEFRVRYGRELTGSEICLFHNDIDEVSDGYMNELVVVGKKTYYAKAENDAGENADQFRMKGISQNLVIAKANESYNGDRKDIYFDLLNDWKAQFDLLAGNGISLDFNNERIIMKDDFKHNVKATAIKENGSNGNIRIKSIVSNVW